MSEFDVQRILKIDLDRATEFLVAFARLEYSAKAVGFLSGNERQAAVDWDALAKHLSAGFRNQLSENPRVKSAFQELQEKPPKKAVLKDGSLEFESSEPQNVGEAMEALLYLKRIRNNLFHGGKGFKIEEADRDDHLVALGLTLIYAFADSSRDLGSDFYELH